jgi:hypothetical protein
MTRHVKRDTLAHSLGIEISERKRTTADAKIAFLLGNLNAGSAPMGNEGIPMDWTAVQ